MAVSLVQQFSVAPGKQAEFMALVTEGSAMAEKAGGSIRWFQSQVAGPNSNTFAIVAEYDNMAAYGAVADSLNGDPNWAAFQQRAFATGAGALLSASLLVEVPRP